MRIKNQTKLAKVIESRYKTREWDKEWSVITHLTYVSKIAVCRNFNSRNFNEITQIYVYLSKLLGASINIKERL